MKPLLTLNEFVRLTQQYDVIPLVAARPNDLETPVSAFLKIRSHRGDFLFESVVGGENWGRFSFLGSGPVEEIKIWADRLEIKKGNSLEKRNYTGNPLQELKPYLSRKVYEVPELPRFSGGLVGYLGYNLTAFFEPIQFKKTEDPILPLARLAFFDQFYAFDNLSQNIYLVALWIRGSGESPEESYKKMCLTIESMSQKLDATPSLKSMPNLPDQMPEVMGSLTKSQYVDIVKRCQNYIVEGDIFQVVPSVRFELPQGKTDPLDVYRALRRINPSPYMYHIDFGDQQIVGASPEILVRLEADRKVAVRPIAGTRRRGQNLKEDMELEDELKHDIKENSEHIMLVDLGRNDIGKIAIPGSVQVDELRKVERYSHVMHLVSHVSGQLRDDQDIFDVIAATFPAGTLSGAPKIRAMEIIEEMEPVARGVFGGAVGYLGIGGGADLAIAIRTAVFAQGRIFVQAGAGVVHESDPAAEYEECRQKAGALLEALKICYKSA